MLHSSARLNASAVCRSAITNARVAHVGAGTLVAEEILDFAQIRSHVVEQDRGGGAVAQPVGCDLPHPKRSASGPVEVERAV